MRCTIEVDSAGVARIQPMRTFDNEEIEHFYALILLTLGDPPTPHLIDAYNTWVLKRRDAYARMREEVFGRERLLTITGAHVGTCGNVVLGNRLASHPLLIQNFINWCNAQRHWRYVNTVLT